MGINLNGNGDKDDDKDCGHNCDDDDGTSSAGDNGGSDDGDDSKSEDDDIGAGAAGRYLGWYSEMGRMIKVNGNSDGTDGNARDGDDVVIFVVMVISVTVIRGEVLGLVMMV